MSVLSTMEVVTIPVWMPLAALSAAVEMGIYWTAICETALVNLMWKQTSAWTKMLMFSSLDIDECMEGTDNCDRNATCTNTDGGFYCTCNNGYSGNGTTNDCNGEHAIFVHDRLQEILFVYSPLFTQI